MVAHFNAGAPVPGHVPPNLVVDFDIFNPPGHQTDYHAAFKRLQDEGKPDIFWTPRNSGHWVPIRGKDIAVMFNDYERFSSVQKSIPKESNPKDPLKPITLDPPEHGKYRALIQPYFTMAAIRPLEDNVRELSIRLIEGFKPNGGCEFVADFAQHLPVGIFMKMVDLPESDRLPLLRLVEELISPGERPKQRIYEDLFQYVAVKVVSRKGSNGTDLISRVANASIDGQEITIKDAVSVCTLVLLGGMDTVASTMGFIAHFLATHPAHRRQLIENPGLIPMAVGEFMRRFAVTNPGRVVARDLVYNGIEMKQGDMVALPSFLYGLDERIFDDSLQVRFDRPQKPNLAFGAGDHRCPGSNLAQVELKVFLQEWLPRIPDFHVKAGEVPGVRASINGSFHYLPLAW